MVFTSYLSQGDHLKSLLEVQTSRNMEVEDSRRLQEQQTRIVTDRETGRSRGFAFVSYTSSDEASSAIQALDGKDFQGRMVRVNYAVEKSRTGGFGSGGGGYSGNVIEENNEVDNGEVDDYANTRG
ncbi:hypothetical protein C3L33_18752, partial [Rhododendron williamsianum]